MGYRAEVRSAAIGVLAGLAVAASAGAAGAEPGAETSGARRPRVLVGLSAGTGYGWATGNPEVQRDFQPGSYDSWSRAGLLQLNPELGVFALRRLALSFEGRLQLVRGTTDVYTTSGVFHEPRKAYALFAKVTWFLAELESPLRPYLFAGAGAGEIRHLAALPRALCGPQNNQPCVDTVLGGAYFLEWGAGLHYRLTGPLDAVAALAVQAGLPGPWSLNMINVDANVGLAALF
jgi:hypothetical protein